MQSNLSSNQEVCIIPIHKPDFKEKLFFMLSGMILSIPLSIFAEVLSSSFINTQTTPFFTELILVSIIAPLLEEFAKAYPLFYRHGETERSLFTLGLYTGLGFGIVEFFVYVLAFHAPIDLRFIAVLFHTTNTTLVAYGIAKKKPLKFYALAVILHFAYNFSAFLGNPWFYVGLPSVVLSFFLFFFLRSKTSEKAIPY